METVASWANCLTNHCGSTTIAVVIAVAILLYWYGTRTRRIIESAFPGIPGPKPWPFLGNLPGFLRDKGQFHLYLDTNYKKYGGMFCTSFLDTPLLAISDTKMIKDILVKHFDNFQDRPPMVALPSPMDTTLDIALGKTWHRIRTVLSPSFSSHKLKSMIPLMNDTCDSLLKTLDKAAKAGESIDILKCQQSLSIDTILSTAFGVQGDYMNNQDDPLMKTAYRAMHPGPLSLALLVILPMLPFGQSLLQVKSLTKWIFRENWKLLGITRKIVELRRKEGSNRKDFLDIMISSQGPDVPEDKKLSDGEIAMQSVSFIMGGYDTSSTTLGMLCYYLVANPDIQERLQQEVDDVWTEEDEMPSYETVQEMQYLDMVISETLRLCPAGNMLWRDCTKECTIEGIKFPKGSLVVVPVYSIHRDPNIYPDPDKFDPERFTPEAKQSRDPYHYLPFGTGPRNCIGMRFALMMIKLVVTRLLKKFTLVTTEQTEEPYLESNLALGPTNRLIVGVKYREPACS